MNPAHRALREGTAEAHARVDAAFAAYDLADGASYARMLAAHASVVLPLEPTLDSAGAAAITPDWPERRRGERLSADLRDLGGAALDPAAVGRFETPAAVAGALYVLEGSRLGGRFLSRRLPAGLPRRYLDADQDPGMWSKLLANLQAALYDGPRLKLGLDAAQHVFALFEQAARNGLAVGEDE